METRDYGTLTPDGARLLRAARDQILADPAHFCMALWDCGTLACIGGRVGRLVGAAKGDAMRVIEALGFNAAALYGTAHPLNVLFFSWPHVEMRNVQTAAARINAFLWRYGYPPDELTAAVDGVKREADDHTDVVDAWSSDVESLARA